MDFFFLFSPNEVHQNCSFISKWVYSEYVTS